MQLEEIHYNNIFQNIHAHFIFISMIHHQNYLLYQEFHGHILFN